MTTDRSFGKSFSLPRFFEKGKFVISESNYSCVGGNGAIYVDADPDSSWSVKIPENDRSWLSLSNYKSGKGKGSGILKFALDKNPNEEREGSLTIEKEGQKVSSHHLLYQKSGLSTVELTNSVMTLPFLETPKILELGIAGKFIAKEIKKIPEPFDLIALVIVEVVVALGGVLTAVLRNSVPHNLLPTPVSVFDLPPLPPPSPFPVPSFINLNEVNRLLQKLPLTPAFILEQTATLGAYIAIQTLS
ncbi:hypothetical protein MLD52_14800 [Puniceicoccaceae bacterium K14]|nr:hypothetical protein [Puniceicoccaceae bacterium K14]